ncbi:MAG: GDSL-type esterase/lipase family protein [bacterium]|nr:GDSL-type esterase/lipase family protein [bacterium]
MSCSTMNATKRGAIPSPPAGFTPMETNAPGKEKISDFAKQRILEFAHEDMSKLQGGIVFVGDSLTHRFPVEQYFPNLKVINRGIGGDTMGCIRHYGVYNRLESTIYNLHPKMIIMMIGINDLLFSAGTPFEVKLQQYEYLVWKIRKDLPETELWCISVLPVRLKFAPKNPDIIKFNIHGKKVAKRYGAKWLDVYSKFLDEKGELKEELAIDSVHLSPAGYELLASLYKKTIFAKK